MHTFKKLQPYIAVMLLAVMLGTELGIGVFMPKNVRAAGVQPVATVSDTPRWTKEYVLNQVAKAAVNAIQAVFLRSLTNWVRSGFKGEPQFIKDPERFFKQLASQAMLNHDIRTAATALCYPFGKGRPGIQIPDIPGYPHLKCTVKNPRRMKAFFDNFTEGGYDMWNDVLEPQNNFYGQISMLSEAGSMQLSGKQKEGELEQVASQGFIGIKNCAVNLAFDSLVNGKSFKTNTCSKHNNVTPGSLIHGKVEKLLSQDTEGWVNAHELSDLVGALVNSVVNKLIGSKFMCLSCGTGGAGGKNITLPATNPQIGRQCATDTDCNAGGGPAARCDKAASGAGCVCKSGMGPGTCGIGGGIGATCQQWACPAGYYVCMSVRTCDREISTCGTRCGGQANCQQCP